MAERELERDLVASSAEITAGETERLRDEIKQALTRLNAVLVAHYYTDESVQSLAEETGGCVADSLEMARFGASVAAETIVVAGVRFMGETAKILSPSKQVLMPTLEATCSPLARTLKTVNTPFNRRMRTSSSSSQDSTDSTCSQG